MRKAPESREPAAAAGEQNALSPLLIPGEPQNTHRAHTGSSQSARAHPKHHAINQSITRQPICMHTRISNVSHLCTPPRAANYAPAWRIMYKITAGEHAPKHPAQPNRLRYAHTRLLQVWLHDSPLARLDAQRRGWSTSGAPRISVFVHATSTYSIVLRLATGSVPPLADRLYRPRTATPPVNGICSLQPTPTEMATSCTA